MSHLPGPCSPPIPVAEGWDLVEGGFGHGEPSCPRALHHGLCFRRRERSRWVQKETAKQLNRIDPIVIVGQFNKLYIQHHETPLQGKNVLLLDWSCIPRIQDRAS